MNSATGNRYQAVLATMRDSRTFKIGVLTSSALLLLTEAVLLIRQWFAGPPVWSSCADPCYAYLLVGTGVIQGHPAGLIEHPGTSFQWMIGGVNWLVHTLSFNGTALSTDVVQRPETFASILGLILISLYLISLGMLSWRVWKSFGPMAVLLLQIMSVWQFDLVAENVGRLSPESLLLICATALLAVLTPSIRTRKNCLTTPALLACGLLCAVGISAKIIFLPVLLLLPFALRPKQLFLTLGTMLGALALLSIPLYSQHQRVFDWYIGVASKSGRHGESGNWSARENLAAALEQIGWVLPRAEIIGTTALAVFFVAILYRRNRHGYEEVLPLFGLLAAIGGTLAIGLKPAEARDFVQIVPLISIIVVASTAQIARSVNIGWIPIIYAVLIGILALPCAMSIVQNEYGWRSFRDQVSANLADQKRIATDFPGSRVMNSYGIWSEEYALLFADEWQFHDFTHEIEDRFPGGMNYNIFTGSFGAQVSGSFEREIGCEEIRHRIDRQKPILLIDDAIHLKLNAETFNKSVAGGTLSLQPVDVPGSIVAFLLVDANCSLSDSL